MPRHGALQKLQRHGAVGHALDRHTIPPRGKCPADPLGTKRPANLKIRRLAIEGDKNLNTGKDCAVSSGLHGYSPSCAPFARRVVDDVNIFHCSKNVYKKMHVILKKVCGLFFWQEGAMPVSSTGYTQQGFSAIRESIAAGLRSGFGQDFLTAPATDGGVLCDLVAASLSEAEAALEALTQCFDRRAASGAQLEALGALLGCYKSSSTYGTVTLTIEGADGTVIPAGTSIDGPDGSAWQTLIALELDATGIGYVPAQCTVAGAIEAPADTLTDDADMPDGVTSVTNESDAVIGSAVQSDSAYRVTILERLAAAGTATYDALYARLKAVNGAGQVRIYRNTLDVADAEGRKPGAVEVVTLGGSAEDLATAIWSREPMGCDFVATGAAWSHDVIDAAGGVQTIRGSYAIDVSLYATITLETESGWSSTTSPDAVKAAIVAWADASLWIGDTVYLLGGPHGGLKAVVASILGVKRVGTVTLHRSGEAGTADQDYTVRPVERARLAKGRIIINA